MASIDPRDRDNMISAVIHLANKNYASLVDDFIRLNILPPDSDRAAIIPLMDKALSPYVKGGGAKKYEAELRKLYGMEDSSIQSQVGGFQAMTQDALTVLNDVPFSIPPYFAILGRAIVTLEGIALNGNPDYGIIMESYPFIARKLMSEDRPEIQRALEEVLFTGSNKGSGSLKFNRLLALLNNAAGVVSTQEGAAFVDIDAIPDDGLSISAGVKYLLSSKAESLRRLLQNELDGIVDIVTRQVIRRGFTEAIVALTPPRPPALPFLGNIFPPAPKLDEITLPILLPAVNNNAPSVGLLNLKSFVDFVAPALSQSEEVYVLSLSKAGGDLFGSDVATFIKGESVFSVSTAKMMMEAVRSGAFGNIGLLREESVKRLLESISQIFLSFNTSDRGTIESLLKDILGSLSVDERTTLDNMTNDLVENSLKRATERLAGVPRVL
jgi:aarF domain-containing kinase